MFNPSQWRSQVGCTDALDILFRKVPCLIGEFFEIKEGEENFTKLVISRAIRESTLTMPMLYAPNY